MEPALDLEALDAALEAQSNNLAGGQANQRITPEMVSIPGRDALPHHFYLRLMHAGASGRGCVPSFAPLASCAGVWCAASAPPMVL